MRATGAGYILIPRESNYGDISLSGRHRLIVPRVGDVYDFANHAYAWVCGTQYSTVANGWSEPINVANKKIRITGFKPGNPYRFSEITFEIEEQV